MSGNLNYYRSADGGNIMSAENFNDGVISLLRTESAFVSRILQKQNYDVLLEMGCNLARSYDIARMHEIHYIGINIRKNVIDALLERAARSYMLPFNLIGNFTDLETLFSVYAEASMDVVVSSWQCSPQASIARSDYYTNCGISDLDFIETDISPCFTRSGFRSEAYSQQHLNQVASQYGFVLIEAFATSLIQCLYFRRQEA